MKFFTFNDARKRTLPLKNLIYKSTPSPQRSDVQKETYELTMVGLQIFILYI